MHKKLTFLALTLVLCLMTTVNAANIVWISGTHDYDADGVLDDYMWVDLLVAQGYTVDYQPGNWTTLDDNKIATMNAADLVIISRCTSSGDYAADAAELNQWDSITTPMISNSTHLTRGSRWKWLDTEGTPAGTPMMQVVDAGHPIFAGVALDASNQVEMITGADSSFPQTADAGNGTVIATRADNGEIWIATWEPGMEYYAGAAQVPAGPRMFMVAGTQEAAGGPNWGEMNLTDEGIKVFLNAIHYMLGGARVNASNPDPKDGAIIADTWVTLSWSPGDFALSHDVYIGESIDDVSEGLADTFRGNQTDTTLIVGFPGFPLPDGLVPGETYYWRIDGVNEADPNSPWKGDVWSFLVPPKTAYFPDPIDGAEFVDLTATLSWTPGFGAKLHTVYLGDSVEDVNGATGGAPQGVAAYKPASSLEAEKVYYWRVDEFDPPFTHKGDIWSFTTPGAAGNSQPANGAVDVPMLTTLSWTPADSAASSDLYFGTDADAVKNATAALPEYMGNKALGSESYDPGKLALGANHYWRVDAVYPDKTVKGLLWSFATAGFIGVDDFEAYNDIDPPDAESNRIFDKWIDGFGTTTNGALVGNDLPPYAERTTVHGGSQSMICAYDNNLKTSEATLTLVYPRDWTEEGVTKLILWFRGASANAAERMFVALNGTAVVYHDDPAATQLSGWNRWVIDLAAFGVDLANVNTITVGFGTKNSPAAGGTGTMYFDDIQLSRPAAAPTKPGLVNVPRTSVAPIIDGQWDAVWSDVDETRCVITDMVNASSAPPENSNDLSAVFKATYDDNNFYILVEVQDSVIDYEFSDWQGDGVEIYFDGDNSKGGSYDGINDNQIRITVDDVELANIDSSLPVDGAAFKVLLTDLGYNVEASFPLARLQISPDSIVGFEVQINDNDSAGGRETLLRWYSDDNDSWQTPSLFGVAELVSLVVGQ